MDGIGSSILIIS